MITRGPVIARVGRVRGKSERAAVSVINVASKRWPGRNVRADLADAGQEVQQVGDRIAVVEHDLFAQRPQHFAQAEHRADRIRIR